MKKKLLNSMRMLLVAAGLLVGANAWGAEYTWDFTNTTTWTTAKIATGSAVNLASDGEAPEGDEPYVTFTFAGAEDYGAEVKYNASSNSVKGTNLWYAYNGSISTNNVSIVVPNNQQATFNLILGSNTRPTVYHLSNEADETNHNITSGNLIYRNTTGSDVTITMWASNTRRTSGSTIQLQNGIVSITLGDITYDYTINAVATIGGVETTISTIASDVAAPEASYSAYASKYVLYGGNYYELSDASNANLSGYKATYTMGTKEQVQKINYKAAPDVVYFVEWEKATRSQTSTGWENYFQDIESSDYSGGYMRCVTGNKGRNIRTTFTVATAGDYLLVMPYYNDNSSSRNYALYLDGTDEANKLEAKSISSKSGGVFSKIVSLTAGEHTIYHLENGAALTPKFDYLAVISTTFTLASDGAQHLTFHNAGSGSANDDNWKINVYNAGNKVGEVRADWWCDVAGGNGNFTNPYLYSADGGITTGPNVWASFLTDMQNADCDLTVSYTGGSLYIIGTMTKGDNVYYVNYTKTGLNGDVSILLYGKNATLTDINYTSTSVNTTYVGPSNSIPVTVTSAGWATLYTTYPLDFSATGLTAYTATYEGSTVTLTEVENVPANTGVVLKGSANTYNIPVIASSTTAQGDLTGNATAATAFDAFTGYDLYMLALNGEGKAQFTKVTSGSIAAGKAFLKVSSSSARVLNVVFDNETTGINNVNVNHNDNWYDLQGRRVAAPQKGLYIVNGKKVVIK